MDFYAIILAAGRGKRMRDEATPAEFPKVLRQAAERPLIGYVIDALRGAGVDDINIIVGFGAEQVKAALGEEFDYILQPEQLGSGHAVACGKDMLSGRGGHAIIMCGDSPLFTPETLRKLKDHHKHTDATITLVSATLDDPTGYGRIKRSPDGRISGVVEEKCASPEEKTIREINGGAYAFDSEWLWTNIHRIEVNEAGELNLTDLVRIAIADGLTVEAVPTAPEEVMGVNTPANLAEVESILRTRMRD